MSYHNYSMDEMVSILTNEPDRDRFIEAAKAFVQKFVDGRWMSDDDLEKLKDDARDEWVDKMQEQCQKEAVSILEDNREWLYRDECREDWGQLISLMKMLG